MRINGKRPRPHMGMPAAHPSPRVPRSEFMSMTLEGGAMKKVAILPGVFLAALLFSGPGVPAAGASTAAPTAIGWNYQTAQGVTGSTPLIIYLQNTSDVTNTKSTTWATAITGMTVVHNATTTLPSPAGTFDITFSGGSPFTYTGGGLYV